MSSQNAVQVRHTTTFTVFMMRLCCCYFTRKEGLRLATIFGGICAAGKYDHKIGPSGNEADLVGPFPGRYGANAHWNAVFRLCPVIFHWFSG